MPKPASSAPAATHIQTEADLVQQPTATSPLTGVNGHSMNMSGAVSSLGDISTSMKHHLPGQLEKVKSGLSNISNLMGRMRQLKPSQQEEATTDSTAQPAEVPVLRLQLTVADATETAASSQTNCVSSTSSQQDCSSSQQQCRSSAVNVVSVQLQVLDSAAATMADLGTSKEPGGHKLMSSASAMSAVSHQMTAAVETLMLPGQKAIAAVARWPNLRREKSSPSPALVAATAAAAVAGNGATDSADLSRASIASSRTDDQLLQLVLDVNNELGRPVTVTFAYPAVPSDDASSASQSVNSLQGLLQGLKASATTGQERAGDAVNAVLAQPLAAVNSLRRKATTKQDGAQAVQSATAALSTVSSTSEPDSHAKDHAVRLPWLQLRRGSHSRAASQQETESAAVAAAAAAQSADNVETVPGLSSSKHQQEHACTSQHGIRPAQEQAEASGRVHMTIDTAAVQDNETADHPVRVHLHAAPAASASTSAGSDTGPATMGTSQSTRSSGAADVLEGDLWSVMHRLRGGPASGSSTSSTTGGSQEDASGDKTPKGDRSSDNRDDAGAATAQAQPGSSKAALTAMAGSVGSFVVKRIRSRGGSEGGNSEVAAANAAAAQQAAHVMLLQQAYALSEDINKTVSQVFTAAAGIRGYLGEECLELLRLITLVEQLCSHGLRQAPVQGSWGTSLVGWIHNKKPTPFMVSHLSGAVATS